MAPAPPLPLASISTVDIARRVSLPKTPPASQPTSANSSDYSPIEELSFDFTFDAEGNYIRLSRDSGKSSHSSPPTPLDSQESHKEPSPATSNHFKPPSPIVLNSPVRPGTLSRSESAYSSTGLDRLPPSLSASNASGARSFQRVASVPGAHTPSASSSTSALRPTLSLGLVGQSRKIDHPRRVTLEEFKEQEEMNRREMDEIRARMDEERRLALIEEKENLLSEDEGREKLRHSPPLSSRSELGSTRALSTRASSSSSTLSSNRPLSDVPVPQRGHGRQIMPGPNRAGRILKPSKYAGTTLVGGGFDKVTEITGEEGEQGRGYDYEDETDTGADEPYPSSTALGNSTARQRAYAGLTSGSLSQSGNTRPRRSASLSDALSQEDRVSPPDNPSVQQQNRPGTSLGLNSLRSGHGLGSQGSSHGLHSHRSAPAPPRTRREGLAQDDRYVRDYDELELRAQAIAEAQPQLQERIRQSPSPTHLTAASHHRFGHKRRDSDTLKSLSSLHHIQPSTSPTSSPPTIEALPARLSPSANQFQFPSSSSSNSALSSSASARHRRSPTAPDLPTASGSLHSGGGLGRGKTWAGDEMAANGEEYGAHPRSHGSAKAVPARQHPRQQQYASAPASVPAPAPQPQQQQDARSGRSNMVVNKKAYARLDLIGKGGSSRVYRVMNHTNEIFAIKRVSLDKTDSDTMGGYMNEIALLKRLDGNGRIIRLFDSEVKPGPGGTKGHLLLVMEFGEIDLSRLLQEQQKEPMNMVWISYYWQQILQAVHVIHEEKIVHSDLKPANFVLVRGQLKLIDFGIANAIANDTTNIQRDHQVGTVNYMSPEAIELPDGMRRLKVGRPSDVWSLGCILYQMVYGSPPFQHLSIYQKMKAIPDLTYAIDFPDYSTPSIPTAKNSPGGSTPPKKLDHLARRVRKDVIEGMKSCLCRNPKERCTIPELMEQDWLAMKEPEPPAPPPPPPPPRIKDLLDHDETVINHHYMAQLIDYGVKLGLARKTAMSDEELRRESGRLVAELKSLEQ